MTKMVWSLGGHTKERLLYVYYACAMPTMLVLGLYHAYYACTMPIYNHPTSDRVKQSTCYGDPI